MIWLAWRQFRLSAAVVAAALAALAVVLALTGPHLVHLYHATVATCRTTNDCGEATRLFHSTDRALQAWINVLMLAFPGIIGIFWGAPLVARELESGTFRLAWTQSISRRRWFATKLGVVGLASMAAAGLMSLMVTWWFSPLDRVKMMPYANFDHRDVVPIAYAAFAFALGVTAGVLIRRTVPAMAATLVAFVGVRLADWEWLRPHLMSPRTTTTPFSVNPANGPGAPAAGAINPADWIVSSQTLNKAGRVIGQNGGIGPNGNLGFNVSSNGTLTMAGVGRCPNKLPSAGGGRSPAQLPATATRAFEECANRFGLREVFTFQPASRYWAFQWYETAIYLGLALILCGCCLWWVRRRLS
jgi:hypothetical protein